MFRYATAATRTLTRQAQPIAPRAFSTSLRAALPTQGGVAPTTSSSSTGTDRGASQVADAQEGKTSPSLNRADQTTNTSASADVNSQPDPNHPQNPAHTAGEDGQGHIPSHTRGAVGANKDGIAGGGNPLKPGAAGRGFHTSARVGASAKPVEEQSAQHPGKSDFDHLENPSLSEEVVHADRTAPDPLPPHKKASAGVGETTLGAADGVKKAADKASSAADDIAGSAGATLKKAAEAVRDTINSVTGGGKRTFSTSAISREDKRVDDGGKPAQHLESSGHDHLEKPSVSEEAAHADRSSKDPLPDSKKASQKSKADQSAGVKSNVREAQKKPVDDLPDGESTLRSIGGGSKPLYYSA